MADWVPYSIYGVSVLQNGIEVAAVGMASGYAAQTAVETVGRVAIGVVE